MGQRIKHRRDAALTWTNNNPILEAGEFGWESNTNRFKIGNGLAVWNSLAYYSSSKVGNGIVNGNIATSTILTATHLLGQIPDHISAYLECVIANNGYAVGDRIFSTQLNVIDCSANATDVFISFSSTIPSIIPKAGGAAVAIIASNWKANARPYRLV